MTIHEKGPKAESFGDKIARLAGWNDNEVKLWAEFADRCRAKDREFLLKCGIRSEALLAGYGEVK